MPRPVIKTKPGAERRALRPDTIVTFAVAGPSKLLEFLFAAMPDRKRTNIKELLKYDQVMVNGTVTRQFDATLQAGDEVRINLTRAFVTFYNRRVQLVYEDDDLLVVNKGYGLLSIGNDKIREGTVFAKNIEAKEGLQHNWNNMVRRRQYVCVVEGKLVPPAGDVKSYLAENSEHVVYSTDNPAEGQFALTRYKTVASANGYTLVEVELETGRKNQIRVHMKDLGHPIAGDRRYGARTSPIHRLALHARTLEFIHPVTRKLLSFSTPVPAPFQSMVK